MNMVAGSSEELEVDLIIAYNCWRRYDWVQKRDVTATSTWYTSRANSDHDNEESTSSTARCA